jgi:hypothetical protein
MVPKARLPKSASTATRPVLGVRDLCSPMDLIRLVRRSEMHTAVRTITAGIMLSLLAGIASKLKNVAGDP